MTNDELKKLKMQAEHANECREYLPVSPDVVLKLIAEVENSRGSCQGCCVYRAQLAEAREVIKVMHGHFGWLMEHGSLTREEEPILDKARTYLEKYK